MSAMGQRHIPFSSEQSDVLLGTGRAMRAAAALAVAKALVELGGGLVGALRQGGDNLGAVLLQAGKGCVGTLVAALFAFMLFKAATALDTVVHTDADDQANLVEAIRQIRNVFVLKLVLIVLAIVFGCLAVFVGLGAAAMQG